MTPLFEPDVVATPFVKLMAVDVAKLTGVPVALVTVGAAPLGLVLAPPKVRVLAFA
jgi:NADPH-dependent 2,4-dienoyl-CoA reductase/sulfur reductase-like enzyme